MSSNVTENVQTKTGSLGGNWEEVHQQMGGSVGRQKWGPWVAEGPLWIIQMGTANADLLECRNRWAQMLKRYKYISNDNLTRSVSVLTMEERRVSSSLRGMFFFLPS